MVKLILFRLKFLLISFNVHYNNESELTLKQNKRYQTTMELQQQKEWFKVILAGEEVVVWPVVKANEMAGPTPGDCGVGGIHSHRQITVIVNSEQFRAALVPRATLPGDRDLQSRSPLLLYHNNQQFSAQAHWAFGETSRR